MSRFTVATWNVNSVRSRLPHLLEWLRSDKPDIVLLQELKCTDDQFPAMEIEELGYNLALYGEKTYNGVAILSRFPLSDISRGLSGDETDTQARYIEAVASLPGSAVRVVSVYVPNGQEVGSDKFAYKLRFFARLREHMKSLLEMDEPIVIGGDYNVAPEEIDVYSPKTLAGSVCFHPDERTQFRSILHLGWYDAFRLKHPQEQIFSWWDYRGGGWEGNKGLRIDYLLCSPQAADKLLNCTMLTAMRGAEKASDHVPVVGEFLA